MHPDSMAPLHFFSSYTCNYNMRMENIQGLEGVHQIVLIVSIFILEVFFFFGCIVEEGFPFPVFVSVIGLQALFFFLLDCSCYLELLVLFYFNVVTISKIKK